MTHSLAPLYSQIGLALIVGNVLLNQIGLPIPAIPTLVVAGAVAASHYGWGAELLLCATMACVLADCGWFGAGRRYGSRVMNLICRMSLNPDSCVNETQLRFERMGGGALVIAKFIPGLATIAPPLAGALKMTWWRFLALSAAGSLLWVCVYLLLGVLLEPQVDRWMPRIAELGRPAILIAAAALAAYIGFKWWERRRFYEKLRTAQISVAELHDLMQTQRAPLIIDVRSNSARTLQPRQIPGAWHLPTDAVGTHLGELPRDREITFYCTCPNEASAASAAKILIDHGFSQVRPLHGGLDAWIAAGYPVDSLNGHGATAPTQIAPLPS